MACIIIIIILLVYYVVSQEKPSEIDLDMISKKVIGQWRRLLTHLEVPVDMIIRLKKLFPHPVDRCFFGLIFWVQGNTRCEPVSVAVLCEALKEVGRRDLANYLEEQMQESSRECPPSKLYCSLACMALTHSRLQCLDMNHSPG